MNMTSRGGPSGVPHARTTSRAAKARAATTSGSPALILDAADRVFERFMPDEVGLKEVAREAGVSHGLLTHYFGTYDALVEAALERRVERARAAILEKL